MRLDKLIIGVVVFSMFIVAGISIFGNVAYNYDLQDNSSEQFGAIYDMINETYGIGEEGREKVLEYELEEGADSWEGMTTGSYGALRVGSIFTLVGKVLNDLALKIGIPYYFIIMTMTILSVSVVFAIVYLVFRHTPPE